MCEKACPENLVIRLRQFENRTFTLTSFVDVMFKAIYSGAHQRFVDMPVGQCTHGNNHDADPYGHLQHDIHGQGLFVIQEAHDG